MRRLERFVGVVVIGTALLGAALVIIGVLLAAPAREDHERQGVIFGIWKVFYSSDAPPTLMLLAGAGIGLLFAAGVALLERRILTRSRRSEDPDRQPLAPKIVMAETRGIFHGPVTITVLIPAHNEDACIGQTIGSLRAQSFQPKRIVVVADNCTDGTTTIARDAGVDVFETVGNTRKKAGALNQVLGVVLPHQGENDLVMVMDADTTLDQGFLEEAARRMTDDRALMAIGGLFYGEEGGGLIGQFQRNEYTRYARDLKRRRGRVFVLTGTASIFRPRAMRTIASERGVTLPGVPGDVYDTVVLTEDNEITLALRSLGGLLMSPSKCTVVTEVMPTWRALWAQRLRWQRGALENLGSYGPRPAVARYWAQQFAIGYGVLALLAYLALMVVMVLASDHWVWFPFWAGIGLVFTAERIITVWRGGWRARLIAATLFPELFYATFLGVVFLKGIFDIALGRQAGWAHIVQKPVG